MEPVRAECVPTMGEEQRLPCSVRPAPYRRRAMQQGTWTIRPCPHRDVAALAQELGVSEIAASVLVRRGYADPAEGRAFLAGEQPLHDPFALGDMAAACESIRAGVSAGKRICVHGDYDADGICATALAVLTLRELGQALLGAESEALRRHLDLAAIATVADVVPLLGENRSLVIAGLRALARTQRPGLRALMRSAGVDPAAVDTSAVAFRLAPRINAAGRLGHPATALELLLTDDADRAEALARELEELNRERQ